jgi:hypothetical protein
MSITCRDLSNTRNAWRGHLLNRNSKTHNAACNLYQTLNCPPLPNNCSPKKSPTTLKFPSVSRKSPGNGPSSVAPLQNDHYRYGPAVAMGGYRRRRATKRRALRKKRTCSTRRYRR